MGRTARGYRPSRDAAGEFVDAGAQLRIGHEQFAAIGMEAFAERIRRELVAAGDMCTDAALETRDDLTAQERQVALLARDGMSIIEIDARLFLSHARA